MKGRNKDFLLIDTIKKHGFLAFDCNSYSWCTIYKPVLKEGYLYNLGFTCMGIWGCAVFVGIRNGYEICVSPANNGCVDLKKRKLGCNEWKSIRTRDKKSILEFINGNSI